MADEIELKLELSPDDAARIVASELFGESAKVAQQVSTYFDTDERAVAKAGYSLRIRRSDGTGIQTIKADGASSAGLFARTEWERPVDDDVPILDYATPLPTVLGDSVGNVVAQFEVRVERSKWLVQEDETQIEVVLDRGEVISGDRSEPICEIELELKLGDPAALFGFARKIDAVAPVRLGVITKSERGYRLIDVERKSVKAGPLALAADISTADAFKRIVQSCIRQFRLNEELLLAGRDPNALHQARVAIRRMRSAFSIFKPMIGDDGTGLRDELKWLASVPGEARDLDVLLDRVAPGPLHDRILAARAAAYDQVCEILASHRARVVMLNVAHWIVQGRWTDEARGEANGNHLARTFAANSLARFRRRIKRRGQNLADIDDAARHEVRKDAKKLRYASEFFASLFGGKREQRRYQHFITALGELQDRLGALNDLATAPELLDRLGLSDKAGAEALLSNASGKKKLLQHAEDAYEELFDTKKFW
ncbi:CHAD domain-containing protein [Sphingopyxis sp.]|uniref:CYTH and CHAD domain-containing protein n=1 Tax=Sphingopyxis sp. TaxID=1908224 RepID=UPI001D7DD5E7|nr:CHAD domain-containing protein [Sphingopyxis sp.]MBW8295725.1 CHAD domain-containing protein [Sphingopyxis sp.]